MGEKILIGQINRGLRNDRPPFMIDNDSFPVLRNAYQWRGRVKRKRGTSILGRLNRLFKSLISSFGSPVTTITLNGSGIGNLETGFSLQVNSSIVPGSVTITSSSTIIYTDPAMDGTLSPSGSINYSNGVINLGVGEAGRTVSVVLNYNPDLPVMGLEDLDLTSSQFPGTLAFDTTYSYNILTDDPFEIYDVSFFKNVASGTYPGYTQKAIWTQATWNGEDYQQFYTANYQGALWATNGINIPFDVTNIGMQFKPIVAVTVIMGGPPATANLQITGHGLVVGDFVFINEVVTTIGINFQTGYVITVTDINNVIVEFPNAIIATNGTGGIAQYLTSRSDVTKDCIRWFDGDPIDVNGVFQTGKGWVNFMPPLSQSNFSVAELPEAQYYLVGARIIFPFKDRLVFMGVVVQSSTSIPFYLPDTVVYSQNGTPYYTSSFTGNVDLATTVFHPILVPENQTATASAYFEDQTGFGGFLSAGISQMICTASSVGDVLVVGFNTLQARMVYTGNDIIPFNFFTINSELGSGSTFSAINTDLGVISRGTRGYIITSQTNALRIDPQIPDEVFEISLRDNGSERFCSQRDFINEWIYFTYPSDESSYIFPDTTLQYNYRDDSWALFKECYTTYGAFRINTNLTWATVGRRYGRWDEWDAPWNSGSSTALQQKVIGGNQQGYIVFRDDGTDESISIYIQSISGSTITSPNHGLNSGDYIYISGALGTIASEINSRVFSVGQTTVNTFDLNPNIGSGTYLGMGQIQRFYVPFIQTKQFPVAWDIARKTRLGPQQYLLTRTANSQITLLIYLSQDADDPWNSSPIVPDVDSINNTLIYSTILYTCPESTNLGLTPANINLNMVTSGRQSQVWHRVNTSLLGDTVQLGFSLSDTQMRSLSPSSEEFDITAITPGTTTTLSTTSNFSVQSLVRIEDVVGMTELNGNEYLVLETDPAFIVIGVDSSAFNTYISGGTVQIVVPIDQTAEIELMGIILDVSPSMNLA